jgi:3-oxoacyl-[acyl-carrier protein] reductase
MGMLDGKTALVTGAGRGIGRGIAIALAEEGAKVVVNDLGASLAGEGGEKGPADQVVDEIKKAGGTAAANYGSVSDSAQATAMVEQVVKTWGKIDILVNVAGILRDRMIFNMTEEEWDVVIAVHLKGTYNTMRAASPHMREKKGGRMINMSSVSALGSPGQPNYAAAKAGIIGFSKSLAREVGSRNITVNCVAPGFIDTDMTRALNPELREGVLKAIPLGRLGRAEDVAAAVVFLASPGAGYMTGCTLHVNGGMHMD